MVRLTCPRHDSALDMVYPESSDWWYRFKCGCRVRKDGSWESVE